MSSFRNAQKSNQKRHRERPQLESRKHLGFLEKKKDYKERAENHQRKRDTIKALKLKALDRNPDEFYFNMVSTSTKEGVHQCKDETPIYTEDQLRLMDTQDLKYVNYKRSLELKKIDRLKSGLHMLDEVEKTPNKHIVFLDSKKQVREFDAAKHFDTHPSLLGRKYNRPKRAMLEQHTFEYDEATVLESVVERKKKYKELSKRKERLRQLKIIAEKLETKKHLSSNKEHQKEKVQEETQSTPAIYKWAQQRKR